jgi:hypothetical protein
VLEWRGVARSGAEFEMRGAEGGEVGEHWAILVDVVEGKWDVVGGGIGRKWGRGWLEECEHMFW